MIKTVIVALEDLHLDYHSWDRGKDYELIEKENHFTLTSNESSLSFVNELKDEVLLTFKRLEDPKQ